MFKLTVESGQEVMETLTRQLAERGVTDGAIVSLIGAIHSCQISNMPADDDSQDVYTELKQAFEVSGTGEIVNGKVHVHAVLGTDDNNAALSGHLHSATVGSHFMNAYVQPLG